MTTTTTHPPQHHSQQETQQSLQRHTTSLSLKSKAMSLESQNRPTSSHSTTASSLPSSSPSSSTCSTRSVINSVLAGYTAGITGTLVGHPMDSAKVWLQTGRGGISSPRSHHTTASTSTSSVSSTNSASTAAAARTAVTTASTGSVASTTTTTTTATRSSSTLAALPPSKLTRFVDHTRALYRGVTGPLLTVGLVQSVNFALYDSGRRLLYSWQHPTTDTTTTTTGSSYLYQDSLQNVATASAVAGIILSFFTSPMLIVKTKQQTRGLSLSQAIRETVHTSSISRMYPGMGPHMLSESGGRVVYYVTYEKLKRSMAARREDGRIDTNTMQERMLSAAAAGISCWISIFPLDALRCRLYAQEGNERKSTIEMAKHMYETGGWRAFYRGFAVTVLRAGPVAAAVLPIYDAALDKLNRIQ